MPAGQTSESAGERYGRTFAPMAAPPMRCARVHRHRFQICRGSALITCGHTRLSARSVQNPFRLDAGRGGGWVTAKYAMLPRPPIRAPRANGAPPGGSKRSALIGRARGSVDCGLGERTITVDCDVLRDGGTRTASVTGGYGPWRCPWPAIAPARDRGGLRSRWRGERGPGGGATLLDLPTWRRAPEVDFNVVMNGDGEYVEVQHAEGAPLRRRN